MSHIAHTAAEATVGALQNLASRGGSSLGAPHTIAAQAGSMVVNGAAAVAPVLIAKAAAVTVALAPVAVPAAVIGATGYGAYKLARWLWGD